MMTPEILKKCTNKRTTRDINAKKYSPNTARMADIEFAEVGSISALQDTNKIKSKTIVKYLTLIDL